MNSLYIGKVCRSGTTVLRFALGGLFIWTGISKLQQPYDFLWAVYNYELVGPDTGLWIARALPWLEIVVGLSLVLGFCRLGGPLLAMALFSVLMVAQVWAVMEDLKIPCGCATVQQQDLTGYGKVAESGLLLLGSCFVFVGSWILNPARLPGGRTAPN